MSNFKDYFPTDRFLARLGLDLFFDSCRRTTLIHLVFGIARRFIPCEMFTSLFLSSTTIPCRAYSSLLQSLARSLNDVFFVANFLIWW